MTLISAILTVISLAGIVLMLRSLFYLYKNRKRIFIVDFLIFSATIMASIASQLNLLSRGLVSSSILEVIFVFGSSYALYVVTRERDENLFGSQSVISSSYSFFERSLAKDFNKTGDFPIEIDYDYLDSCGYNVPIFVNSKVCIIKRKTLYEGLEFDTYVKPGGKMGWQVHPDCIEDLIVYKGHLLIVDVDGNILREYKENDHAVFEAGEDHIPCSNLYSEYRVYFKKIKT